MLIKRCYLHYYPESYEDFCDDVKIASQRYLQYGMKSIRDDKT